MSFTFRHSPPIQKPQQQEQAPFFQKQTDQDQQGAHEQVNGAESSSPFFQKASSFPIQLKLTMGQPGDKYEQEADQVADQVVGRLGANADTNSPNTPSIQTFTPSTTQQSHSPSPLQAKCGECEEKEKVAQKEEGGSQVQRKPIFDSEEDASSPNVQTQRESAPTTPGPSLESSLNASKGGGSPLPEDTRTDMEGAMGSDFSGVRVHTGSRSDQMNQELGAKAFTHGSDIYFRNGNYDTGSKEGKELLAHELVHTVQQGGSNHMIQNVPDAPMAFHQEKQPGVASDFDLETSIKGVDARVKWDQSPKLRLRSEPNTDDPNNIVEHLDYNAKLKILGEAEGGWYNVRSSLNNVGYVAKSYVATNLPDPEAKLHRVEAGLPGYAISIAEKYYKRIVIGGIDLRNFINVLAQVNLGYTLDEDWKKVHFKAGNFIWIPGAFHAQKLIASYKEIDISARIIDEYTSWYGNLEEDNLGYYLFQLAITSNNFFPTILEVIEKLDSGDRDEVSYYFIKKANKKIDPGKPVTYTYIDQILDQSGGKEVIDRMYGAMSTDWLSSEDEEGSLMILNARMRRIPPDELMEQIKEPLIFPLRQGGITVIDDAPMDAEWSDGKVRVDYPMRVCGTSKFKKDLATLEPYGNPCLAQIKLDPQKIVGVRLYDEGEIVKYIPAEGLILYSNIGDTNTLVKIGEVASLAAGGFGGAMVKGAGWFARALIWTDRVAAAIGIISTIINEHRGWIIKTFGEDGRAFLNALNTVNTVASIYGIGRLASGLGYASVRKVKYRFGKWKAKAQQKGLSGNSNVKNLDDATVELINSAEKGRLEMIDPSKGRPYKNLPDDELDKLVRAGDKTASTESIHRQILGKHQKESEFLAYTKGKDSVDLDIVEAKLELELAQAKGAKRTLIGDVEYEGEIIFNGHKWKKVKGANQWCRHSNGELCFNFGLVEGTGTGNVKQMLPEGYEDMGPHSEVKYPPGYKKQNQRTALGTFVHSKAYKDFVNWLETPIGKKWLKDNGINKTDLALDLPTGNVKREFRIEHPDYSPRFKPRADVVDFDNAIVHEIKPKGLEKQGFVESQQYAEWLNKYHPRADGKKWTAGETITYDGEKIHELFKKFGFFE